MPNKLLSTKRLAAAVMWMLALACGDAPSESSGVIEPPPRSGSLAVEGTVVGPIGEPIQAARVVLTRVAFGSQMRLGACSGFILAADTLGTDHLGRFRTVLIGGGPTRYFCLAVEAAPPPGAALQTALLGLPVVVTPSHRDVGRVPPPDTLRLWIALRK